MNLLSCYKAHSKCEPYFITWSMNIVIANEWVIYIAIFIPQSRHHRSATCLVRTAVVIISSWPGQDVTRAQAGSSLRHVFSGWRPRPNWRWPDAARSPECAHASRFLRTTLASAVTLRTCDGLTLTRGDIGGSGSTLHGQNIFRWRSLNFKTTGQNYYGVYILSPGL